MVSNLATDNMSTPDAESLPLTVDSGPAHTTAGAPAPVPPQVTRAYVMHPVDYFAGLSDRSIGTRVTSRHPNFLGMPRPPANPSTPGALEIPGRRHGGNDNLTHRRRLEKVT